MLIDINLLPKKEKRNPLFIPLCIGIIAIAILGALYLYYEKSQLIAQKEFTEQNIEQSRELRIMVEQQLAEGESTNTLQELERMIAWMETVPVSSVEVLNHLASLLPSRGFLTSITYGDNGLVTLETEFNALEQVSAYLFHLQQSPWIDSADLHNVSAVEEEDSIDYYTASFTVQFDVAAMKVAERGED